MSFRWESMHGNVFISLLYYLPLKKEPSLRGRDGWLFRLADFEVELERRFI